MIHVIDNHLTADNQSLLRSMFADRKRLFVDLFGWDVPVVDGQYEIDQFDNAHTIYLIAAEEGGGRAASIRLFPTTQPHMLGALFPHACPLGVPVDNATWESTRLCLPQRHGAMRRRELRNLLFSAMVDVALQRGIERYTGIIPGPLPQRGAVARLASTTARPCGPHLRRFDRRLPHPCSSRHAAAARLDRSLLSHTRPGVGMTAAVTGLTLLLQSNALCTALGAYTLDGPYGRLLDAAEQYLAFADVQCFETEALMGQAGVVAPVLTYLFHRLEERFDGRPTLLVTASPRSKRSSIDLALGSRRRSAQSDA